MPNSRLPSQSSSGANSPSSGPAMYQGQGWRRICGMRDYGVFAVLFA